MIGRVVWRRALRWTAYPQELQLPGDARVVHVGLRPGGVGRRVDHDLELSLWYELAVTGPLAPARPDVARRFQVFGTGDADIPLQAVHVGSVLEVDHVDGVRVWHVYELPGAVG